ARVISNSHQRTGIVKVEKGNTVYSLSQTYGVDMQKLIALNKLHPPYTLNVGQDIRLPRRGHQTARKADTHRGQVMPVPQQKSAMTATAPEPTVKPGAERGFQVTQKPLPSPSISGG